MEPEGSLPHSQEAATCSCSETSIQSMPSSHFLNINFNIILLSMSGVSKWSLYLRFPHQNPVYACLLHTCYIPRPSHSPWFDHPNNIGSAVQIIQLLIMQSSPPPPYLGPVRSKYPPQQPVLRHPPTTCL